MIDPSDLTRSPRAGGQGQAFERVLLPAVLLIAAALRFTGLNWDVLTHMHPDERFLTMVETSIRFPETLGGYFDTANSPLNPHNAGHGFFVYGSFPIFLVRALGDWLEMAGYDQIHLVGRIGAASFDLLSVFLLYVLGERLFSRRVGLAAAAFGALSVLPIQHAHFFVVDAYTNTFILAGILFATRAMDGGGWRDYALFGVALGMSMASKISSFPLAGLSALAALVQVSRVVPEQRLQQAGRAVLKLGLGALVAFFTFRVLQPYAFQGPTFFGLGVNPEWIDDLSELMGQTSGNADFPPALQWANRTPLLFPFENLVLWGLGWPLGALAWLGWGWAAFRMARGEWQRLLLPVAWTGGYFLWRGASFTSSMRHHLPIYPTLALLAAWVVWDLWNRAGQLSPKVRRLARATVGGIGSAVLLASLAYAVAFARNYRLPFTRAEASRWIFSTIPGPINLVLQTEQGERLEPLPVPGAELVLAVGDVHQQRLRDDLEGTALGVLLPGLSYLGPARQSEIIRASVVDESAGGVLVAQADHSGSLTSAQDNRLLLTFPTGVPLQAGSEYGLRLELLQGAPMRLRGSTIISESSWDDGLPLRLDDRDGYGGLYRGVNQELYWWDNDDHDENGVSDKFERILASLTEADYLVISSNRQYGTITRVPQRYPLTTAYYRALFDCPAPESVLRCAAEAEPGELEPRLGYELVAIFQRDPTLGPLRWRDQAAEEAFTVYDHPKVLIFAKRPDFSADRVRELLQGVDLSRVVNAPPNELGSPPRDLLLPQARLEQQRAGGTWSQLFSRNSVLNRWQPLTVLGWWLAIGLVGLLAFPLVRAAFGGLREAGYPLARLVGLLFIAWASWMAGSLGLGYTRGTIALALLILAALSAAVAWRDREGLLAYFKERRKELLWTEALILAFFLFDLAIRLGNPDLWHRYLGGEKPMDFSYLNAVIKSTSFPPFDPWYAGGYINYYYFGFVLVGTPVKLLGVIPSIAYNLILPTLFALSAAAAYCVGYNLVARLGEAYPAARTLTPRLAGAAAALMLVVLGNLGTARMIYDGLREMGAGNPEAATFGPLEAVRGLGRLVTLSGQMPYALHHWYWNPSRAIPPGEGEPGPITEFPFFTFLYADLHAHMIALPLTVVAVGWALSTLLGHERRSRLQRVAALFVGALVLGALGPTNTWDYPVYWALGAAAAAAAVLPAHGELKARSLIEAGLTVALLLGAAHWLYRPYHVWYGRGYTAADLWAGSKTTLDAYLTVHGLFLFLIVPWLAWETRQWMAATPLTALARLRPYFGPLGMLAALGMLLVGLLTGAGYRIAPLASVLLLWPGLLLLRRDLPMEKRAVLIMVASGAALTFMVEVVVLRGDIARMNTVFKFYLQVWTLFSLASAAALAWLLADLPLWGRRMQQVWTGGLAVLTFAAALYPATATGAKIRDRMSAQAPHSLEGAAFMRSATYHDLGASISLEADYRAIQWAQENIPGSPVIVEAQIPEYRWGSRFSIYTGLPAVLGWNWHQRQQRAAVPNLDVSERSQAITDFYLTQSTEEARRFLERYAVRYVIVGELERLYYAELEQCLPSGSGQQVSCSLAGRLEGFATLEVAPNRCTPADSGGMLNCPTGGLEKFERMVEQGMLRAVYRDGATVIYEVAA